MRRHIKAALMIGLSICSAGAMADVRGVVMTREGAPIAKAKVSVYALETAAGARARWQSETPKRVPIASVNTNDRGEFATAFEPPVALLQIDAAGFAPSAARVAKDDDLGAVALAAAAETKGVVRAGATPVEGVHVVWISGSGAEVVSVTDGAGRYSVPNPEKWGMRVSVVHADYAVDVETAAVPQSKLAVDRKLSKGVTIEGRVLSADGKTPAAGAAIFVDGWELARSGDDGAFSVRHAMAKWQELRAVSGAMSAAVSPSKGELVLRLAKTPRLTGVVRDAQSRAVIAGAEVIAISSEGDFVARASGRSSGGSAVTNAKGAFAIELPTGAYEVQVSMPGYAFAGVDVSLVPGGSVDRALPGTKMARVIGRVSDEENRPVVAAWVAPATDGAGTRMGPRMRMTPRAGAMSGPDGRFVLRDARPDESYVLEATKKGHPAGSSPSVKLASGETKTGVVITIPRGIEVAGLVTDESGSPVSGVTVVAGTAERGGGGRMMIRMTIGDGAGVDEVETSADGRFSMRLAEGKYDLTFRRAGFAPYRASSVDVRPGVAPIEVTMLPGATIAGRVVRSGGGGVDGAMVAAMTGGTPTTATTGPDGGFVLEDLTPGSVMLMVRKPEEFLQVMRSATAPSENLTIEVPKGESIAGRVVDKESGNPIRDFSAGVSGEAGGGGMRIVAPPVLKSFRTDDGTFQIDGIPAGPVQFVVSAPGYMQRRVPGLVLEEGKPIRDLEVALETGTRLYGRVTGPDGRPLVSVRVSQRSRDDMRGPMAGMGGGGVTTDAEGNYQLEAIEPGERSIEFEKDGYPSTTKTVNASGRELRLDVQLGRGATVAGVVVTEGGSPVGGASVRLESASAGSQGTKTDASGAFRFEGISEGRFSISAEKSGYVDAELSDVDSMAAGNLRLVLGQGGRITGRVTGLQASEYSQVRVNASTSSAGAVATPDSSGAFTIEGAPTGTVRVVASKGMGFAGSGQTTEAKTVELQPGGEAMVDLEFRSDRVVAGRVTRNGSALEAVTVRFAPKNPSVQTRATATTDSAGRYEARGLDDGEYDVTVFNPSRMSAHNETRSVTSSSTIDIDIVAATLRGRVTDSDSGEPIAGARVSFDPKGSAAPGMLVRRSAESDGAGNFVLDDVSPGSYSARAEKEGFGQDVRDVDVGESGSDGIDFRIAKNDGLRLRVVDARSGTALGAQVRVTDALGRIAHEGSVASSAEGTKISLAQGSYRVSVWADGYAPIASGVTAPSAGTTLALTPGGTIEVELDDADAASGKLVGADGLDYLRMFWPRQGAFRIDPGVTTLRNITPGSYSLVMLDASASAANSYPVSVSEGRVTRVKVSR